MRAKSFIYNTAMAAMMLLAATIGTGCTDSHATMNSLRLNKD